jgi:hypothetical protein
VARLKGYIEVNQLDEIKDNVVQQRGGSEIERPPDVVAALAA